MKIQRTRRSHLAWLTEAIAALLLVSPGLAGDQQPAAPAKPTTAPTKPATPTKSAPPVGAAGAAGAASKLGGFLGHPSTAGSGGTSTTKPSPAVKPPGGASAAGGAIGTKPPGGGFPPIGGGGNKVNNRPQPKNAKVEQRPNGVEISKRANGTARDVHVPNHAGGTMDIHHTVGGGRRVEVERADHSRIVAERGGRGYVQHPYKFRGQEFARRTYFVHGRYYDHFYGRYQYHGVFLDVYAPGRYYPVAFYGWAYNPWGTPAYYAWGWAGSPWYGYYGAYFTPYPAYSSAYFWLTDYLISESLAADYQAQVDAQLALNQPLPAGQVALTPEVKQEIADEVRRQVELEYGEARDNTKNAVLNVQSSSIQDVLADRAPHVFMAGGDLDLLDAGGQECVVSQGDVLQYTPGTPPSADGSGTMLTVIASKGGTECRRGLLVSVSFVDLQNMQNYMRETVDAGLADLQSHRTGLPAPPPSAMAATTDANIAANAPPPDPNVASEINQQAQEADQTERAALNQPNGSWPANPASRQDAGPPPTVTLLGMSTDEVVGVLGEPRNIVDLGTKKVYVYSDNMKITFKDGRATAVD
jgi:hypothetical protein